MKSILKNSNGNAVSTGGKLFTVSANYTDQIKQALIDKGVATEDTPSSELVSKIESISPLKKLLDSIKTIGSFFSWSTITNINDLIKYNDTENVERMGYAFYKHTSLIEFNNLLNMKSVKECNQMFEGCSSLKTFIQDKDEFKPENVYRMFYSCSKLETVDKIDLINCTKDSNFVAMFEFGSALVNLYLSNIKLDFYLGYSKLLSLDSLINTIKELVNRGSTKTLTIGSANLEKITNVYVRRTTEGDIPTCLSDNSNIELAKAPCEVCESTDDGAMSIIAYANSKNWTLA